MRQLIIICIAAVVSLGPVAEGEVLCEPLVVPGCVLITRASSTSPEFRVYDPAGGNCYYRGSVSLEYMGGEEGTAPAGIEVGPNGNIFVWEQNQGPLHEHDGVTGEYLGQATVGDTGLQGRGFCFLPDGDILISGGAYSKVARFDGDTGAYLGDFVPQGSGGLSTCFGVTLGPNGNLFACSVKSNQVLQYDGNTGAFLGVYASVLTPYDLAFDSNGSLFVSTRENGTVVQISPDGTNLGQFNQVNIPPARGIDIGLDGDVYVASWDDYGGFQEGAYRFDRNTGSLIGSLPTQGAIFCSVYRPESGSGCALDEIEDCFGNCCPADWIGDGYCDDGGYSWNGIPIYLNCGPFDCDGGDCQPESCSWLIQDCFGNWFPSSWVGDGYCDNGTYSWNGIPIYLTCEEFDCDGGDCPPEACGISPTGVCCYNTNCTIQTEDDCSGTYLGDGTDCSGDPCAAPTGACCTGSSCNITSQPDCTGDWLGVDTTCELTTCVGDSIGPVEWTTDSGGNGHAYELVVVPEGISWHEANDMARQMGGHLATLTSEEEHLFVFEQLAGDVSVYTDGFWGPLFGAYQDASADDYGEPNGGWRWVTGETWDWSNWLPGEPSNGDGVEDVGQFAIQPPSGELLGHWNDWYGASSAPVAFIVEYPIRSFTWEADEGGNGHVYELVVVPEGISWHAANDMATEDGWHLATLTSEEEHLAVFERLANDATLYIDGFWGPLFGAYQDTTADDYSEPDGGWRWVTGEPWDWTNWLPGQPDNGYGGLDDVGHYVIEPSTGDLLGYWNDWPGSYSTWSIAFIMEYTPPCIGNVNDDFEINISDLLTVIAFWGTDDPLSDINDDGTTNVMDLLLVIANWGPCP
jgi:hypothetical protein